MSKIQIIRDGGYADRARSYKIICDNECLGKIRNGESLEFEVPAGKREIFLKIDWCQSNKVNVDIPSEGTVILKGGSNLRGIKLLLAAFYIIFMPQQYLWLESASS